MNFILLTVPGYGLSDFLMALGGVVAIAAGIGLAAALVLWCGFKAIKCWVQL